MKTQKLLTLILTTITLITSLSFSSTTGANEVTFSEIIFPPLTVNDGAVIRGVDISSIIAIENAGVIFRDADGNPQDIFRTLQQNGVNYIRVRVWNDPKDARGNTYGGGNNDVRIAAEIGKRAAAHGMKLLVNFHYSDFWADPGKQTPPKAWQGFTLPQLETAIYNFTLESLRTIRNAGADIGMVQVGNETNYFMCGLQGMNNLARLMSAGSRAIREFDRDVLVAVHFTDPAGMPLVWYAQELNRLRVDYDVYMTSYYSFWHGTIENLTNVLSEIARRFGKYVMVAEMAHPYTYDDGDNFGNAIQRNTAGIDLRYAVSPQGQVDMLTDVYKALAGISGGIGAFYWEPAWLGVHGLSWQQQRQRWITYGSGWATDIAGEFDAEAARYGVGGSSYDNKALFDFTGKPLPSLAFYKHVRAESEGTVNFTAGSLGKGINYSPYTGDSSPGRTISPTLVREHLTTLSRQFDSVRFFSAGNDVLAMYDIAAEVGLKVIGTAWIDRSMSETAIYRQLDNLINLANSGKIAVASVGSEVLYRSDKTPAQMLTYMNYVKSRISVPIPVTTMDTTASFNGGKPELAELNAACDVILFSHYPFFSWNYEQYKDAWMRDVGIVPYAIAEMRNAFRDVQQANPGKPVIVAETGWPTGGEFWYGNAKPTPEHSRAYWDEVQKWAEIDKIDVFWFSAHDERWKPNAGSFNERHWGLFYTDGVVKEVFSDLFSEKAPQKIRLEVVEFNGRHVIEIWNLSDKAISAKGLFITDNDDILWQIPSFIIQSSSFVRLRGNDDVNTAVLNRATVNFVVSEGMELQVETANNVVK